MATGENHERYMLIYLMHIQIITQLGRRILFSQREMREVTVLHTILYVV